jgi:hypothetical protein
MAYIKGVDALLGSFSSSSPGGGIIELKSPSQWLVEISSALNSRVVNSMAFQVPRSHGSATALLGLRRSLEIRIDLPFLGCLLIGHSSAFWRGKKDFTSSRNPFLSSL